MCEYTLDQLTQSHDRANTDVRLAIATGDKDAVNTARKQRTEVEAEIERRVREAERAAEFGVRHGIVREAVMHYVAGALNTDSVAAIETIIRNQEAS